MRPWKRFALHEAADEWDAPRRVVWIDNEPASGQTIYLEKDLTDMHPNIGEVKLVRPDEERGLTLKDLRRAAEILGVEKPAHRRHDLISKPVPHG